ncbi:hypothetical protein SPRG_03914 [Saprolegnia parasitica CBS 223.65]|uniref:ER membrane protein complex subunit 1 n=1 Tax=Saprolegnia parasitica (strain CBS 223.65) TaxID=695850 RepID=A0A067CLC3_SAPPC|nr:hypothetical protein SPRG_03914 [Saprolegnia parasitica CBS 223.65]KDO31298.1 hypothetical protein SPRG_03914 [Saprolegnia parasitica CBS 223.65]|eukprot:XP_012197897.1 hypothetical protein SPRG_03914 [Saprolegnia parasitica CBS 223.65]
MRGVLAVLVALCCAAAVSAIYEDQVGEFDWHRAGLGEVHHVAFPSKNSKNFLVTKAMYVATEANVLAKVDLKTSDVAWRHVLPEATAVEDLVFCDTHESVVSVSSSRASAASTRDATLVRQWDAVHGHLLWQAYVPVAAPAETPFAAAYEVRSATDETILAVVRNADVTILGLRAGDILRTAAFPHAFSQVLSTKLSVDATKLYILGLDSVSKTKVVVQVVLKSASTSVLSLAHANDVVGLYRDDDQDRVVAVAVIEDGSSLHLQALYDLAVVNTIAIASLELSNPTPATPLTFVGIDKSVAHAFVLVLSNGKRLFARVSSSLALTVLASLPSSGFLIASAQAPGILFHASLHAAQNRVALVSYHADASPSMHLEASIDVALYGRAIARGFAGVSFKKTGKTISVVRVGLVMADASLILLSNEKPSDAINPGLVWIRDEALAYVTKAYWVTPAGVEEQALSVIPSFTEELALEGKKLLHFFQTLGASPAKTASETSQFFGFSKLLILSTSTGKVYALASETGDIVWSRYVGRDHRLVVTRDHPAFGAGAELLLVGADSRLTWIDAEDGRVLASEAPTDAANKDTYVVLLPKQKHHEMTEAVARRVVGVVDASLDVALYPPSSAVPDAFYFYRYNKAAHAFEGFHLDETKTATLVWSVVLPTDESIVAQSVQAEATAIESSVTITGDDSLLVKYLNPHLFGVATLDAHNVLQVSLIDAVSGRIVHRAKHAQVAPSVQMVQSENWLVYTFWSLKTKRTELVSVALFERAIGARDLNPWVRPVWADSKSSFDAKAPYVLQKSFIFPSPVSSLGATLTARGITPQFVLVGMANGQIFKLARNIIDPRVPEGPPTPEQQEEGLVQYSPYIQVLAQPFSMVSHNQTLQKLEAIVSAPANLESTSLTFAFGLDLYYVRLAPANAFDVLPSDFNYELLLLLIAGFVGGAYGTKLLAERKLLHEQWK